MMLYLYVTLTSFLSDLSDRTQSRLDRTRGSGDEGMTTLELVVLGLGLFLLAGAVVAVITGAVNSRTSQIK